LALDLVLFLALDLGLGLGLGLEALGLEAFLDFLECFLPPAINDNGMFSILNVYIFFIF